MLAFLRLFHYLCSMNLNDKKIALLLSGGVDSSVVLYELVRQGLQPDCFYIKIGPEEKEEWDCSSEEDLEMATAVSHKYGCKLEVIDCHKEYWDQVTRYTMEKVRAGLTPNPDVMCNRLIKFGAFDEKRGHDYDLIATGHYAQTEEEEVALGGSPSGTPHALKWLCTSPDPVKDQTDRAAAERAKLPTAKRRDSQGICFLNNINYNDFVRHFLGEKEGDIIELETGKKIGEHKGLWFHTIGQRKGLGFGGGPWFVIKKDVKENVLYVSHGYDPETAYKQEFLVRDFHWLTLDLTSHLSPLTSLDITFKIRHTSDYFHATMEPQGDGTFMIRFEKPIHGVAPGQFCVVYDNRHHRCYGSGEITL